MKYYSYEHFKQDTNKLINTLNSLEIESIVAIARGGLMLSHAISEGLDVRDVQSLKTELYDGSKKRDCITIQNNCIFKDVKKVLIVDDISDSGETLKAVIDELKQKHPDIEFISATLFFKRTSIYEPDFWINDADEWIEFFWEKDFL
ncbi:MAG: phosphoribosyltransferase family protein [Campylobacterales bacterium]